VGETGESSGANEHLTDSNGFLIAMLGQESRRRFMAHVSQWEVGWPHQRVLSILAGLGAGGTTSQRQLSELADIDPRNIVPVIDLLEQRQLIVRAPDPSDRRKSGVTLTGDGARLARKIQDAAVMLEQQMFSGLGADEQDTLHDILLKLYRSVQEQGREDEREPQG
jgi:MarR family transcriptional regulator, lower aerobic nicotinate degradation pathway regulator